MEGSTRLRQRLRQSGYSDSAISAAWPNWWTGEAETSASAQAELRFSLARKLGVDPRSLVADEKPIFVWKGEAKFKHLTSESEIERAAMSSYGISIGRTLTAATPGTFSLMSVAARDLRRRILATRDVVGLRELLGLCWGVGIPAIHLRVFPLSAKRMCAMSTRIGDRFAILVARDAGYPARIAFYLAHELGHIALGHLQDGAALIDLTDPLEAMQERDEEEQAADRYALELLTGRPDFKVDTETRRFTAKQLAATLLQTATDIRIEPGTLALCFGYTTGKWAQANAAMKRIYGEQTSVWKDVNIIAQSQLDWSLIPDDLASFLQAVIDL